MKLKCALLGLIFLPLFLLGFMRPYAGLSLFSEAFPDQVKATVFSEDFDDEYALTSDDPVAASSPWIGTAASTGTFAQSTDEVHGVAVLTTAATDNDSYQIQGDMEAYGLVTSKDTIFYTRFKVSDATQTHLFTGLSITDTTMLTGGDGSATMTMTDAIGIAKYDGAATLYLVSVRDSTVVGQSAIGTLADATYIAIEFRAKMRGTDGTGRVEVYINGTYSGEFTATTLPYNGEEILTPSFALCAGEAGAKTATIDALRVAVER